MDARSISIAQKCGPCIVGVRVDDKLLDFLKDQMKAEKLDTLSEAIRKILKEKEERE
jgi:hypothetical protein